jgi:hypothetical protein
MSLIDGPFNRVISGAEVTVNELVTEITHIYSTSLNQKAGPLEVLEILQTRN